MNKNYTIAGIIVLIIAIFLIIAFISKSEKNTVLAPTQTTAVEAIQNETPTTTPTREAVSDEKIDNSNDVTDKIIVMYTSSGFSPKIITVDKGQTVEFVNKSDSRMSVASDPHPTHTIYPEFDQYKTDARGKSVFDFAFQKVGTWEYHNHLQASDTGTVIVK